MSLLRDLGLTNHDVSDVAHQFNLKHTADCRAANASRRYICICDFWTRVKAKCFALAFDQ